MLRKIEDLSTGDKIIDPRDQKDDPYRLHKVEKVMDGIYDLEAEDGTFLGTWRGERKVRVAE